MNSSPSGCLEVLEKAGVRLLWADSLGAKSFSFLFRGVLVDPGAAAMQPSYPLSREEKLRLREEALKVIREAWLRASAVVITHYHHDHYIPPPKNGSFADASLYLRRGLILVVKNPNFYINKSQWARARLLFESLAVYAGVGTQNIYTEAGEAPEVPDAPSWVSRLRDELWSKGSWVRGNLELGGARVLLGDELSLEVQGVSVHCLGAWFHGIMYSRTGWVMPVLLESGGWRILYTSDLMGPEEPEYAGRLASLRPDVVLVDGPPTYLYPYLLNRANLLKSIESMVYIIENSGADLIVYDHHLLREPRWRERVAPVFEAAEKQGVSVVTVAECLGVEPLIDRVAAGSQSSYR